LQEFNAEFNKQIKTAGHRVRLKKKDDVEHTHI